MVTLRVPASDVPLLVETVFPFHLVTLELVVPPLALVQRLPEVSTYIWFCPPPLWARLPSDAGFAPAAAVPHPPGSTTTFWAFAPCTAKRASAPARKTS